VKSPWDDIADLKPEVENPINIVKNLFSPIYEKTGEKVIYKLQEVNFFPEEVRTYGPVPGMIQKVAEELSENDPLAIEKACPDFGYDPYKSREKQYFRYRLLLSPIRNSNIEYELFKFKFPLLFYPVQFFIEKDSFGELSGLTDDKNGHRFTLANDKEELCTVISTIIKSESTLRLIRRLMVI